MNPEYTRASKSQAKEEKVKNIPVPIQRTHHSENQYNPALETLGLILPKTT